LVFCCDIQSFPIAKFQHINPIYKIPNRYIAPVNLKFLTVKQRFDAGTESALWLNCVFGLSI
jgi:hypothetical protein